MKKRLAALYSILNVNMEIEPKLDSVDMHRAYDRLTEFTNVFDRVLLMDDEETLLHSDMCWKKNGTSFGTCQR